MIIWTEYEYEYIRTEHFLLNTNTNNFVFMNQIFEYSNICKYSNILEYSNKIRIMTIILDKGFFFDFAYLSLAPTPVLAEAYLNFSFNLSNHPPTLMPTQPGKLQGSSVEQKKLSKKLSVYIRRVQ